MAFDKPQPFDYNVATGSGRGLEGERMKIKVSCYGLIDITGLEVDESLER